MSTRGPMPHWRDMQVLNIPLALIPILLIVIAIALPFAQAVRSSFAAASMTPTPAAIDGDRAYKYLKAICALGPHPAGSTTNAKVRAMVSEHFKKHGGAIREQPFKGIDPSTGAEVAMVNLIGSWHPERSERVVIGAHYDTRPFPDEERDPEKRRIPFIGANDPGSGIALLMELAHHLAKHPTPWGIDLVLFDGEELVYGKQGEYFLGSKEFARAYVEDVEGRGARTRYARGLVLDMVGGRNLRISQEPYSLDFAPGLVSDVWSVARKLKVKAFRDRVGRAVQDDHLSLINADIPTIDIIDFDYPYWHTSQDLPENCSGESLAQVGRVLTGWLSLPKPRRR